MLQAVIGDDGIESAIAEREPGSVGAHKLIQWPSAVHGLVQSHNLGAGAGGQIEAPGTAAQIQHARPARQIAQNFVQAFLS